MIGKNSFNNSNSELTCRVTGIWIGEFGAFNMLKIAWYSPGTNPAASKVTVTSRESLADTEPLTGSSESHRTASPFVHAPRSSQFPGKPAPSMVVQVSSGGKVGVLGGGEAVHHPAHDRPCVVVSSRAAG